MKFIIGCSGFHYKHWKGDFYPQDLPASRWFGYYCQHFKTLELNTTFYRFPALSTLEKWYNDSPTNFLFAAKVPRSITHFKKLNNCKRMVGDFYKVIDSGLKEKLGCILFQFPPNFAYSNEHLQRILDHLDPSFNNVVEFRHQSWWRNDLYTSLGEKHISFCGMSHPDFPDDLIINSDLVYYRMHGQTDLYQSDYGKPYLDLLAARLRNLQEVSQVYVYFNNDVQGYAPKNAAYLAEKTTIDKD